MEPSESERSHLISTEYEEITPVDYVQVRRQRRQICVGVAIVCCLGVGLSLAVAIPLVSQQTAATAASGTAADNNGRLMRSAGGPDANQPGDKPDTEVSSNSTSAYHLNVNQSLETTAATTDSEDYLTTGGRSVTVGNFSGLSTVLAYISDIDIVQMRQANKLPYH